MRIYLDMDDVVADWRTAVEGYVQWQFPAGDSWAPMPPDRYERLHHYRHMYRDLRLKSGAQELVQLARTAVYSGQADAVEFLTAIPRELSRWPASIQDKVEWVQHYFSDIPVRFSRTGELKAEYCSPGDVLIDDRAANCAAWRAAGGTAVVYRDWAHSQAEVRAALGMSAENLTARV